MLRFIYQIYVHQLSQEFIDMCDANAASRAGKAAATGAINSVANNLTYALDHPVDAAVTAAIAAACGAPGVIAWQTYKIYENWDQISAASQQFVTDIQNDMHHDSAWLDKNIQGFTQLACDIFLAPRVGTKIMNSSRISPLTNGFRQQAAMAQNCVNATAKKACENLKTIFKQAGDAIKSGNPQPAFAGINNNNNGINNNNLNNNNNASFKTAPTQPRRSERLAKKAEEAGKSTTQRNNSNVAWTNHGHKHFPQKHLSWKDIIKSTKTDDARYKPGVNIEAFERMAWQNGTPTTNGKSWKVFTADDIIGAKNGLETRHIRVEMNTNTIHGHPITPAEFKKYTK